MKIGIDMGGSHIAIATVNEEGRIVEKVEQDLLKNQKNTQYILNYVDKAIEKLSKTANINEIGIACPGNAKGSKIQNLVNLSISEIDFKELETKYQVRIKSINDAKAAAIAEKAYGVLNTSKDGVFLCLGTGIGGAVFLNNQLLEANRNPGFELGHMVIEKEGIECKCGKRGCFETYCSMKRFKENIKRVLEVIAPEENIENSVELKCILERHMHSMEINKIVQTYINDLVIGLSNVIDIFEPEIICLGGSFVYFEDILYKGLMKEMKNRKYVFNKEELPKIELAKLGNDAGIIGATLI